MSPVQYHSPNADSRDPAQDLSRPCRTVQTDALLPRREFFSLLALAASVSSGSALASEPGAESVVDPSKMPGFGKAKHVIYLTLSGGLSQMDSFDPKPGTPSEVRGETKTIGSNVSGIQLGHWFPKMARQMDKWCVVRSRMNRIGAHDKGLYFVRTAYAKTGADTHPHLGAWMSQMIPPPKPTQLPSNFLINAPSGHPRNGWMAPEHAPLPIGDPIRGLPYSTLRNGIDGARLLKRLDLTQSLSARFRGEFPHPSVQAVAPVYRSALDLMRSEDLRAFDLTLEPERVREAYGMNSVGQGLLLARRLVERGVQHVEVHSDGWDHHVTLFRDDFFPRKSREVDDALSALIRDLDSSGLLSETLVVVTTEFGRTPEISDVLGRNHWPQAFSCLLAGAGVKQGFVHGSTDAAGREVTDSAVDTENWCATIAHLAGLPWHIDTFSPSKRPFRPGGKSGRPVFNLIA